MLGFRSELAFRRAHSSKQYLVLPMLYYLMRRPLFVSSSLLFVAVFAVSLFFLALIQKGSL
jgi:hypothetical protein